MTHDLEPVEPARLTPGVGGRPLRMFAFAVIASVVGAAMYGGYVAWRQHRLSVGAAPSAAAIQIGMVPGGAAPGTGTVARPFALFRRTALGPDYGRVDLAYLDDLQGQRFVTSLECDRVHYQAGHGICLEARRGVLTSYVAHIFDERLAIRSSHFLAGPPSRARISPDGRLAAFTVFTSGHSYSTTDFATRTTVVDATGGHILVDDLETFEVLRNGVRFRAADSNFWGVSFARDSNRFYATLGTGGVAYLVEGDIARRTMRVVHDNVECPSLSPDGKQVAFKRRVSGGGVGRLTWRLFVLDLASNRDSVLESETSSVDDQVEWLDNAHVVYALPDDAPNGSGSTNVWTVPVAGTARRRLLLPAAFSPAIVR